MIKINVLNEELFVSFLRKKRNYRLTPQLRFIAKKYIFHIIISNLYKLKSF